MKKILVGLVSLVLVFSFVKFANASLLDDLKKEVGELRAQIALLKGSQMATALSATNDTTPRVMYWWGKVNQHIDSNGVWQTDPDGVSGANLDKLTYCKKWYPDTISVEDYKNETIDTWRERGNINAWTSTKMSTECVQSSSSSSTGSTTDPDPIDGDWSDWQNSGSCVDGYQAQTRTCTNPVPSNGGATCSGLSTQNINCYTTPVVNGGWSVWSNTGSCINGIQKQERKCNNPVPSNGGATCSGVSTQEISCNNSSGSGSGSSSSSSSGSGYSSSAKDTTPRIMYWYGKVNQHVDSTGAWQTDPDGVSGANLDKLTYCKKFWPNTTSVETYKTETIDTWRAAGNTGAYSTSKVSDKCVLGNISGTGTNTGGTGTGTNTGGTGTGTNTGGTGTDTGTGTDDEKDNKDKKDKNCQANVFNQTLQLSSKGSDVESLQLILNDSGFLEDNGVDGIFGPKTKAALIAFQISNGLEGDGIAGPLTRAVIKERWQAKCLANL